MKLLVLLSAYNGEVYLRQQLDSLLAQTLPGAGGPDAAGADLAPPAVTIPLTTRKPYPSPGETGTVFSLVGNDPYPAGEGAVSFGTNRRFMSVMMSTPGTSVPGLYCHTSVR